MKKKILLSVLAAALLACLLVFTVSAEKYGKFEYKFEGNEITITDYDYDYSDSGNLTIPSSINGYPVTKIGSGAFQNIYNKSVTIPSSVKVIDGSAFSWSHVASITIPSSVNTIGNSLFQYCYYLESVSFPNSITKIPNYTFSHCSSLDTFTIPSSVTEIGEYAFRGTKISTLEIPSSVTKIGYAALWLPDNSTIKFAKDSKLSSIDRNVFNYSYGEIKHKSISNVQVVTKIAPNYFDSYSNVAVVYSADGRQTLVRKTDVAAYTAVGWYTEPVTTVYALDGRSKVISTSQLQAYKNVGWYDKLSDVQMTVFSYDGRSKVIYKGNLAAEKAVGWYPGVTMYALDGRTTLVNPFKVEAYKKVGWYANKSDVVVTMYAADGRTTTVYKAKIDDYKAAGWYLEPVTLMYAADGRTKYVEKSSVEAYKKVGWYLEPVVKMYALDGRSIYVEKSKVAAYRNVGWYDNIYDITEIMYSVDHRTNVVYKWEVAANQKVGWYTLDGYVKYCIGYYGYEWTCDMLEDYIADCYDSDVLYPYIGTYQTKFRQVLNEWYASIGVPVAVLDWSIGINSIGTPEITVYFRNISQKTIINLDTKWTCYDAYGYRTADFSWYNGDFTGYFNSGYTFDPGEEFSGVWTLYSNEKTSSISWPQVQKIAFQDGTTWYR